jgi:N-acetylglucosamine kinase-like BadF-type ATPase
MIVGIDIGGTKTHLMARTKDGALRERVIVTSDWRGRHNQNADAASLVARVGDLVTGELPDALVIGSHGCDTDDDCSALQALVASHLSCPVLVLNDSELLLPAAGKATGISVIAGTGSIAVGRSVDRTMIAAGGWGWYLGDEGSASGLVREAARAVRSSLDAGNKLDPLGVMLMAALGISAPVELGRSLGMIGSAAGIAALSPHVFDAADAGSSLALEVIRKGGLALSLLVEKLIARGAPDGDVVTGGGVMTHQPKLFASFQTALAERLPGIQLTLLATPPVKGALVLAEKLVAGERPGTLPRPHIGGRAEAGSGGRAA